MYLARLDPKVKVGHLTYDQLDNLYNAIITVFTDSISASATTCGYYDSQIHTGNYECIVYKRKFCPLGTKIETFEDKKKRTVYYSPVIQPEILLISS